MRISTSFLTQLMSKIFSIIQCILHLQTITKNHISKIEKIRKQNNNICIFFFFLGKGGRGLGKLRTISRSNLMIYSIVDFGKLLVKKRKVLLKATRIHLLGVGAYSLTRVWSKKGVQGGSVNSWVQFPLWSCGSIFRGAIRERESERQRKR